MDAEKWKGLKKAAFVGKRKKNQLDQSMVGGGKGSPKGRIRRQPF